MTDYRIEKDSLGEVKVPKDALYGAQTQRAVDNFPVSGIRFPHVFIRALGLIKTAAAEVNGEMKLIDADRADAIRRAALEVAEGKWDDQFPLDVFQTDLEFETHSIIFDEVLRDGGRQHGLGSNDRVGVTQSRQTHQNDTQGNEQSARALWF